MATIAEFCGNNALHFIEYGLYQLLFQYCSGFRNLLPSLNTVALRKERDSGEEEMKLA